MILRDPLQDRVLARDMYPTFFFRLYNTPNSTSRGLEWREREKKPRESSHSTRKPHDDHDRHDDANLNGRV